MYRYVIGDDREQILGIQGLLSDSYEERYNLPKLMPHSSILGYGFAKHNLLIRHRELNIASHERAKRTVRDLFATVMSGLDKNPTQEIITVASLSGELLAIELLTVKSKTHADRTVAYNSLGRVIGHSVDQRVPHITIGWIPHDTDPETKDQIVNDANGYLNKYFDQLTINLGSPTHEIRRLESTVNYTS